MKLAAVVLLEAAAERFTVTYSRLCAERLLLSPPLLYDPNQPVQPGQLYLTEVPSLALCREDVCAVYLQGAVPAGEAGNAICLDAALPAALNGFQAIFARYDRWEEELEQIVLEGGSLRSLLAASHELLGNPLLLVGADFTLTAQAGGEELEQLPFGAEADSMELINALKQDILYNRMREERSPFLYPAHIMPWRSWNLNLFRSDQVTHRLMLLEYLQKLRSGDGWLLERLVPYVRCLLDQAQVSSRPADRLRTVFLQILSDRTADYVEMSRQLSQLDWAAGDRYFCLVFKVSELDRKNLTAGRICGHVEQRWAYSCSFLYREDIVTFFNVTKGGRELDEIAGEMKLFIRESFLKAGYSRVMEGHDNLRRQYIQARAALEVGGRVRPHLWIHHFNSIAFPYLLEQVTRQLPGYMVCHEKLLGLRQLDEAQGTAYTQTLRSYLDQHMNAAKTAKSLFIHRSTLLYRLERIRELLEDPLDDPETLLYLAVSFRLLEDRD